MGKAASTVAATMSTSSGVGTGWAVWHPTNIPKVKSAPTSVASLIASAPFCTTGLYRLNVADGRAIGQMPLERQVRFLVLLRRRTRVLF